MPDKVALDILAIFDGLSFFSVEFGVLEYLRGHSPFPNFEGENIPIAIPCHTVERSGGNDSPSEPTFIRLMYPGTAKTTEGLPEGAFQEFIQQSFEDAVQKSCTQTDNGATHLQELTLCSLYHFHRALMGTKLDLLFRAKISKLRLQCFFVLVHSKLKVPLSTGSSPVLSSCIKAYLKLGNLFLKDLVDLANFSSDNTNEIGLSDSSRLVLSSTALECVLGLLENKLRRRKHLDSCILSLLGLDRYSESLTSASMGSQDDAWASIVMSACSLTSNLLQKGAWAETAEDSKVITNTGKFVRIGLEMFALSLTTRDPQNVVSDIPLIGTVVALLQALHANIDEYLSRQYHSLTLSALDSQVMMIATKALYCLECSLERGGYMVAFRESDGVATISNLLELFARSKSSLPPSSFASVVSSTPLDLDYGAKCLLEGLLNLLNQSLIKSKQIVLHGGATDSGIQIIYQSFFGVFCQRVFDTVYDGNEEIWKLTLYILKEAVDIEPAFLAVFLVSPASAILRSLFLDKSQSVILRRHSSRMSSILLPICKFAQSACITLEGRNFIGQSKLIEFVVESLPQPTLVYPLSSGISTEKLSKIGKTISQIMMDNESVKVSVKVLVKDKMLTLCREASTIWVSVPAHQDPLLCTQRMQVLQKLANMCMMVEGMFVDNKTRHSNELLRDLLSEQILEALMDAYICTLPPAKQLFIQLSIRDSVSFGCFTAAKSITSLLKFAAHNIPHIVLPLVYKHLDSTMNAISSTKQTIAQANNSNSLKGLPSFQYVSSVNGGRRKSRGSSLGGSPTASNVHVLGVLSNIPNYSVLDPLMTGDAAALELQAHVSKLLSSVLLFEWNCIMLSNCLRSGKSQAGAGPIVANKDVLRRLFAFYRSSLLEVCSFNSKKLSEKVGNCFLLFLYFSPYSSCQFVAFK